ncbi:hypothetical protein [Streptomyces brevispora]|uniref:hypothetical protein n=1 Tax=Streptomyces brevispora TaxID=887462 RepID=UPI0035D56310
MSSTEGGVRKWLWSTARAVSHSQVSRCATRSTEATPARLQQQDTVGDPRVLRVGDSLRGGGERLCGGGAGALVGSLNCVLESEFLIPAFGLRLRLVLAVLMVPPWESVSDEVVGFAATEAVGP